MNDLSRVALIGVTGFIGRGLPALLAKNGYSCTGISRSGHGDVHGVDRWQSFDRIDLSEHDVVINLAGERIDQRWNASNRKKFHDSRVGVTQLLVEKIHSTPANMRPKVMINCSAVGIYGDRGDERLNESSSFGEGYLAELCYEWEEAAKPAELLGLRVVCPRIGVVLGRGGPAFEKLLLLFKFGLGGKLGNGQQWMPWIHIEDLRAALLHAVSSSSMSGPVNCTAPHPERNSDFTRKFAASLHRPAFIPVPGFALKLGLGGFGGVLLAGQRALPSALLEDGFQFRFATLESALVDLTS